MKKNPSYHEATNDQLPVPPNKFKKPWVVHEDD
jgi:hypothetical protein